MKSNRDLIIKSKLKESKNKIRFSLLSLMIAASVLLTGIPESKARGEGSSNTIFTDTGEVTYSKTAKALDNGNYEISFDITGTIKESEKNKADVLVVMDISESMDNKIDTVKTCVQNLYTSLLDKSQTNGSDVQVGIETFSSGAAAVKVRDGKCFTSNKGYLDEKINTININGSTNTEEGIKKASSILQDASFGARSDSEKYVVFFTDGYPTMSHSGTTYAYWEGSPWDRYKVDYLWDANFVDAQTEFNKDFGFKVPQTVGGFAYTDRNFNRMATGTLTNPNEKAPLKDTKVYTIGWIDSFYKNVRTNPKVDEAEFLWTIQKSPEDDITDVESYRSRYIPETVEEATAAFTNINESIKSEINTAAAEDIVIQDFLSDNFVLPDDPNFKYYKNGEEQTIRGVSAYRTENTTNGITIEAKKLGQETIKVTFEIKPENDYFSGKGIETNNNANIKCKGHDDPEYFEIPKIDINPKIGTITIRKHIGNDSLPVNDNDNFTISLKRDSSDDPEDNKCNDEYNVRIGALSPNNEKVLNVYLKDIYTEINPNSEKKFGITPNDTDLSKGYLNVGQYTVNEIVPMNYKLDTIMVNGNEVGNGGTFTVDYNNPNIVIDVTNNLFNDKYWFNHNEKTNTFKYDTSMPSISRQ